MSTRGARLIEAMKIRGMQKQYALAYTLGVNESTITRWKNDGSMSLDSAIALCQALDVSLDWFLVGSGPMDRETTPPEAENNKLVSSFKRIGATLSAESHTNGRCG